MSLSAVTKTCVKLGRQSAYGTSDFVEVFGAQLNIDGTVDSKDKDQLIIMMANTIMNLSVRGKFNLWDL